MIALRGKIRHKSIHKIQTANPNHAPPSSDGTPFNPLTSKDGEWIWTGHWAFGGLPDDDEIDAALSQSTSGVGRKPGKRKPPQGVRPFVYKFEKVVEAKDVVVPSSIDDGNEGDQEQPLDQKQQKLQQQQQAQDKVQGEGSISAVKGEGKKDKTDEEMQDVGDKDGASIKSNENSSSVKVEDISLSISTADHENAAPTEDAVERKTDNANNATVTKEEDADVTMEDLSKESTKDEEGAHDKPAAIATDIATDAAETNKIEVKKEESKESGSTSNANTDANTDTDAKVDDVDHTHKTQNSSTFAEVEGGTFTDAARTTYPDKCPVGGCWKGFFENVSVSLLGVT